MSSKSDKVKFWIEQEFKECKTVCQNGEHEGKTLTLEDRMILMNIAKAAGGSYQHLKTLMDMRYGISASGTGAELSGSVDDQINVTFGTRDE